MAPVLFDNPPHFCVFVQDYGRRDDDCVVVHIGTTDADGNDVDTPTTVVLRPHKGSKYKFSSEGDARRDRFMLVCDAIDDRAPHPWDDDYPGGNGAGYTDDEDNTAANGANDQTHIGTPGGELHVRYRPSDYVAGDPDRNDLTVEKTIKTGTTLNVQVVVFGAVNSPAWVAARNAWDTAVACYAPWGIDIKTTFQAVPEIPPELTGDDGLQVEDEGGNLTEDATDIITDYGTAETPDDPGDWDIHVFHVPKITAYENGNPKLFPGYAIAHHNVAEEYSYNAFVAHTAAPTTSAHELCHVLDVDWHCKSQRWHVMCDPEPLPAVWGTFLDSRRFEDREEQRMRGSLLLQN